MLYKGRYRATSIRLPRWDYRSPGNYFVTICVQRRWEQPFGFIKKGYVCLSDIGTVANQYWINIPDHFANVSLDTFVVMPDHLHGIIKINDSVETCHGMSLQRYQYNEFSKPMKQSLPMIVNQFKSSITRWCRQHEMGFQWQPRYYEKIIRSEQELQNVRAYILNNPKS